MYGTPDRAQHVVQSLRSCRARRLTSYSVFIHTTRLSVTQRRLCSGQLAHPLRTAADLSSGRCVAGILEAECEVREAAVAPHVWGRALALVSVLLVVHGEASVTTVDIRSEPGTMYGAVRLEAAWPFAVPVHLLGIVQLHTSASVSGFGAPPCVRPCTPTQACCHWAQECLRAKQCLTLQ